MATQVYVLGGEQTDFARNWYREGLEVFDLFADTVRRALERCQLAPNEIDVGHVGNFVGDLFTGQAQLGGFFGHVDPAMQYLPASRHEAACASGSMALLAAMADIESGRYELACVVGLEIMRNVPGQQAADYLRPAAWASQEWSDTPFVWPCAFSDLIDIYEQKHGIDRAHLHAISEKNFAQARHNPNAQSRDWQFDERSFSDDDDFNPAVVGNIRRTDCGQITDGAAVLFLASEARAAEYARQRNIRLDTIPRIKGWGHINAPMAVAAKMRLGEQSPDVFPHVRQLFEETLARAGMPDISAVDGIELHDCFNITEYMILDHAGLRAPGQIWQAIEAGETQPGGQLPTNMSGGLIGQGHPVGATGVRMLLDAHRQVTGTAGGYQIAGAQNMMTFNLGGSATTCASFVLGR